MRAPRVARVLKTFQLQCAMRQSKMQALDLSSLCPDLQAEWLQALQLVMAARSQPIEARIPREHLHVPGPTHGASQRSTSLWARLRMETLACVSCRPLQLAGHDTGLTSSIMGTAVQPGWQ